MTLQDSLAVLGFEAIVSYGMWFTTTTILGKSITIIGAIIIIVCAFLLRNSTKYTQ